MSQLLILLTVALPLAWLLSETQRHRWISILLGCASLGLVAFVAEGWGSFKTRLEINQSFGDASKSLAAAILQELDAGNVETVRQELKQLVEDYQPNYENYPPYREAIAKTIARLRRGE